MTDGSNGGLNVSRVLGDTYKKEKKIGCIWCYSRLILVVFFFAVCTISGKHCHFYISQHIL